MNTTVCNFILFLGNAILFISTSGFGSFFIFIVKMGKRKFDSLDGYSLEARVGNLTKKKKKKEARVGK